MKKFFKIYVHFLILTILIFPLNGFTEEEKPTNSTEAKPQIPAEENPCFFYIGAIKSIAGVKPSTELFDIFIKFNFLKKKMVTFASIDFAFTEETDDEADIAPENLTEAGFSFNLDLNEMCKLKFKDRHLFLGLNAKVFDNDPYLGVHFGSFETNETLFSSYFTVGYLQRWYSVDPDVNEALDKKEFKHNLFIEFAIHSPELPFIKDLRLKGGILLPFRDKTGSPSENDIKVRIVLEIPIGGVKRF